MSQIIRTRFAPSPTGYLHIGGARTALFAWLYARAHQGQFILRIEDTDLERSTEDSVQAILDGMAWLKLDYDEGPFYQTQHFDRYRAVTQQLLASGHAYRCYCSKERLVQLRETQTAEKIKPRYDGCCRDKVSGDASKSHVVRFKNPLTGNVVFEDQIRGAITVANAELDDLIIARTDGTPTYNFCVVVDDWDMKITDVIRGDDHINNTPRQINILKALCAEIPRYAHVPMILGSDGKRLSKRHGAVSVLQYREAGYLPDALANYLVRLGWSSGDKEIFSRQEMIDLFRLSSVSRSPAIFNSEKLDWLNQYYLKNENPADFETDFKQQLIAIGATAKDGPALTDVIRAQAEKVKTLKEMAEHSWFFYADVVYDDAAVMKYLTTDTLPILQLLKTRLLAIDHWNKDAVHTAIMAVAQMRDVKLGVVAQPLRVAVTGNTISPSIDVTVQLIGQKKVLARLDQAIALAQRA